MDALTGYLQERERREALPRHRCPSCQFEFSDEDAPCKCCPPCPDEDAAAEAGEV